MIRDREGNEYNEEGLQSKILNVLYKTTAGRVILKILICPEISKIGGIVLNSRVSRLVIPFFVRANHIDPALYEAKKYRSYNEFFIRKKKKISINEEEDQLIAPCDSKLSVYKITEDGTFHIKNSIYTMESLVRNKKIAKYYQKGYLLQFRLTVDDYHRYCYIDDGKKSRNYKIPGVFHTVNPIAVNEIPVYKENTREYSLLKSKHFGTILMMEVGALLVGKIINYHEEKDVVRGEEKGRFEFGGSTVLLCIPEGKVEIDSDLLENTRQGYETIVKMGETIGHKKEK